MKSMNLEQISMVMDKFEQQFEDIDVQTESMENSIGGVVAQSVPQDQVDMLMLQVADEAGLEVNHQLGLNSIVPKESTQLNEEEHVALNERLAKLRNS
ncbi:hypothetical protein BB559_001890 [Furculomyces boomerangus]|uniref:Uncharacterized protein n=2 Tax=Harpellales TaxID=61421 RepID=A0A2T9YZM1_9FUNG|nr:hypothetical protein BB559_001890 [Furculomyces boomerangus]